MEDERLIVRIVWYVDHIHELVDHHDQFLSEIDLTRMSRMRRETKVDPPSGHSKMGMGGRESRRKRPTGINEILRKERFTS